MSIQIQSNHSATQVQRHIAINTSSVSNSQEKLSTGYRINNAGDDAAGLSISENLEAKIRANRQAQENV